MEEAKPPPQKPMGRGEAWALSGDVLLRSLRLWADMATITEWALQGRTFPSFCGLSGFAIGRIMEIAMADATYPKEVIGAAFGFGLASHARKSAQSGRRTEAYAMLRLVTTACAAPTALGRFYQLGGRGDMNWLDIVAARWTSSTIHRRGRRDVGCRRHLEKNKIEGGADGAARRA